MSLRWLYRLFTVPVLSLFLLLVGIGLGCSVKKPLTTSPSANLPNNPEQTKAGVPDNAAQTQKTDVTTSLEVSPGVLTIHPPQPLNSCDHLPPICAGGLLPQDVSDVKLHSYLSKYGITGCRYMEPPLCPKNYKRKCLEECTP